MLDLRGAQQMLGGVGNPDLVPLVLDPGERNEDQLIAGQAGFDLYRHPHRLLVLAHAVERLDVAHLAAVLITERLAGQAVGILDRGGHLFLLSVRLRSRLPAPSGPYPAPRTAATGWGRTPNRSASAVPCRAISGTCSSSTSSQVTGAVGPISSSTHFSVRLTAELGAEMIGRRRWSERSRWDTSSR